MEWQVKWDGIKVTTSFRKTYLENAVHECMATLGRQIISGPEIASVEPALRDALLPRLMSGEVRLMKMEKNK